MTVLSSLSVVAALPRFKFRFKFEMTKRASLNIDYNTSLELIRQSFLGLNPWTTKLNNPGGGGAAYLDTPLPHRFSKRK